MTIRCALCMALTAGRPLCPDCWNVLYPTPTPPRSGLQRQPGQET